MSITNVFFLLNSLFDRRFMIRNVILNVPKRKRKKIMAVSVTRIIFLIWSDDTIEINLAEPQSSMVEGKKSALTKN